MKKQTLLILIIFLFTLSNAHAVSFTMPTNLSTDTTNYVLLSTSGTTPAISGFSTDVKIVVSVSTGTLKITTTTGLTAPQGYTTTQWATGASEISFEGTQTNVNNALATLSYLGGASGSAALKATATPTGADYNKDNGHYYQYITADGTVTWATAKTNSSAKTFNGLTGYLATITSSSESAFILAKVGTNQVWFGASDAAVEGQWKWITGPEGKANNGAGTLFWTGLAAGTAVNGAYTNWATGEPNNAASIEQYMELTADGKWNDVPGGWGFKYVVEYGDLNGESAIVFADTNLTIVSTQNPPTLLSSTPVDGAVSVALGANIILTFSEAVDVESGNITLKRTADDSTVETIVVTSGLITGSGTKTITINPTANLAQNTGYYLLIDATAFDDATSQSYAGISSKTTLSFSTSPNISYSASIFTEASTNDGSISTSITLTLSNDTYVNDVVSGNRVTATNVPAGLTANFVRTSDTIITITLTGTATNHANTNSITDLTFTFADGSFTNTGTASDVTNYAKNDLKINFTLAGISYSGSTYSEVAANDGSTTTSITLTLTGDNYHANVVSSTLISASSVPAGLTANFVRTSNTVITATLTGNATSHTNADDIANMKFTFLNGAFTTISPASTVTNYAKNDLVVDFTDPVPNVIPTLGGFANVVDFTNPNTEVEITLAELKAQGDEADADGTVDGFVIKAVSTGTLKIGTSATTATAFDTATNNTVNTTNNAYWTPATDSDETLNAFTAVALDNNSAQSTTARQVQVFVSIDDTFTPIEGEDLGFSSTASLNGNSVVYSLIIIPTDDNPTPPAAPVHSLSGVIDIDSTSPGNNGYSLVVTFNLPANSRNIFAGYWKYGPEAGGADHWYDYGSLALHAGGAFAGTGYEIINGGKTLNVYLIDGIRGDDVLGANAAIKDPGLPLLLDANGNPIPSLSFWGLMILSFIIVFYGTNYRKRTTAS